MLLRRLCARTTADAAVLCRADGGAAARRSVSTSAALERRIPRPKLPLNTECLPRSEQMQVSVTDEPDHSRGVPQQDGGIKYYGFTYYPRFPDQPDPPVTPSKLHRVELIAPVRGQPYWVKDIVKQLGLDRLSRVAIVKNIPEVNAMLYQVKHVIRMEPITFPEGTPTKDDLEGWQLLEDGRVVRNAAMKLNPIETEYDQLKIGADVLRKRLQLRWIKPFWLDEKRTV